MKQSYRYEQASCRLRLDGLPDLSASQTGDTIGILTGWELDLIGHPTLEGKRNHLEALLSVVLPYARHLVSGVPRRFGDEGSPVQIEPIGSGPQSRHRLRLFSSQPDTPPLELDFDDAELADLVRCLDQLRLDPRVQLGFVIPTELPLQRREILERVPLRRRLLSPAAGLAALVITSSLSLLVPLPKPVAPGGETRPAATSAPAPPPTPTAP